jgi:hypothetical protein
MFFLLFPKRAVPTGSIGAVESGDPDHGPVFQQPNGNDIADDPAVPAMGLPDPNAGGTPVMMPPAPGHKKDDALGTGTAIGALSPVPSSPVAPSGMFALPRDVTTDDVTAEDPGTEDRPADVGDPVPAAPQPVDVIEPAEFPVVAPLSITELELTLAPEIVGSGQVVLPSVGPTGAGLNPPTKSSVAPNGTPEPPIGDVGTIVPNGDVVPAPGVERALSCAALGPTPSSTITVAIANTRSIETSVSSDDVVGQLKTLPMRQPPGVAPGCRR